jgi:GTPase SAR1 family protein
MLFQNKFFEHLSNQIELKIFMLSSLPAMKIAIVGCGEVGKSLMTVQQ